MGDGFSPQTTAVRFNNGATDRQSHPDALRVGRKEGFSGTSEGFPIHSLPRVRHRQTYIASSGRRIAVGEPANLTLIDLDGEWTAGEHGWESRSENSCFTGRRLRGRVLLTMAAGAVVYRERAFSVVAICVSICGICALAVSYCDCA